MNAPHHTLSAADAERSAARLADIELGLAGGDAWYWKIRAEARIRALVEDEPVYGLLPHEEVELDTLKRLVGRHG